MKTPRATARVSSKPRRVPRTGRGTRLRTVLQTVAPSFLLAGLLLALLPGLLAGCAPDEKDAQQAREEIREMLLAYLPKMAEAYRTGDVEPLTELATERERAVLHKQITELEQQGRVVDTELLDLTIEDLNLVSYATAYVTTAENWRVRVYAVGTDRVLGEDDRQFSRVRYQLGREGGRWVVMGRNRDPAINS